MATSGNFEQTMTLVAPAGGVTAFTLSFNTTSRVISLPLQTATSGNSYVGKVVGFVGTAPVASVAAMVAGQPLTWSTANTNFTPVVTGTTAVVHAWLAAPSVSTTLTGDVILTLPTAVVLP